MSLFPPIQYNVFRVRLIACLLTANVVWYVLGARATVLLEELVYEFLTQRGFLGLPDVTYTVEVLLVFVLCILPAAFRVERPVVMVLCSTTIVLIYAGAFWLGLYTQLGILPITGPLLGLAGSTIVLGGMAWSSELQRRRALETLEHAKQNFTDMLVHDLKSRTSSIFMSISLLEKELLQPTERSHELVLTMRTTAERLLLQISALLDIRKIQEGKMDLTIKPIHIDALINDLLREFHPAAELVGVSLDYEHHDKAPPVIPVDPEILSRILANLVWNGLKYAPKGSSINLQHTLDNNRFRLSISNHGPTLSHAEIEGLFHAFVTGPAANRKVDSASTGLGLTFCKLAAESHGGSISMVSPWPGHEDGVQVTLELPV